MEDDKTIDSVKRWLQAFVVEKNLCPFARQELAEGTVRFVVTHATTGEALLRALRDELQLLDDERAVETTLLIHPHVLQRFDDYNEFLSVVDGLLVQLEVAGVYQVASFHPSYQFADTDADDAQNYSNRSPYPLLHILREESVERAIDEHSDVARIPLRNIDLLNGLGKDELHAMWLTCFDP